MYIFKLVTKDLLQRYEFRNRNIIVIATHDFYLQEGRPHGKAGKFITMAGEVVSKDIFLPARTPIIAMMLPSAYLYQGVVGNNKKKNLLWLGL